jgi:hypothetical protein
LSSSIIRRSLRARTQTSIRAPRYFRAAHHHTCVRAPFSLASYSLSLLLGPLPQRFRCLDEGDRTIRMRRRRHRRRLVLFRQMCFPTVHMALRACATSHRRWRPEVLLRAKHRLALVYAHLAKREQQSENHATCSGSRALHARVSWGARTTRPSGTCPSGRPLCAPGREKPEGGGWPPRLVPERCLCMYDVSTYYVVAISTLDLPTKKVRVVGTRAHAHRWENTQTDKAKHTSRTLRARTKGGRASTATRGGTPE